jgi:acetyl-CoA carboxylase biotin carboxyl carrier protein
MDLTSDDVQDILQLLDSLPYGELHLQTARFRLSLRRTADGEWTQETTAMHAPTMLPGQPSPAAAGDGPGGADGLAGQTAGYGQPGDPGQPGGDGQADGLRAVRAPLLGTFYRAPRPGAPPFVDVGSHVEADTVVGIIETMKLMNSVCAGVRGTIAEILIADAQFAQQDSALMRVREER